MRQRHARMRLTPHYSDGHHRQQTTTYDCSQSTFDSYRSTRRIDGTSDTRDQGNRAHSGNGWMGQWLQRLFTESEVANSSYHMPLLPQDDPPKAVQRYHS
jgi:hypothetical protein